LDLEIGEAWLEARRNSPDTKRVGIYDNRGGGRPLSRPGRTRIPAWGSPPPRKRWTLDFVPLY
jgi:hypothetical protein